MLFRLLLTIFFTISLYATPSLSQVKAAYAQNPALLESPQAKAMMKEKGVTAEQVKHKLTETSGEHSANESTTKSIENNVETTLEDTTDSSDIATDSKNSTLSKRVNPFVYKTNKELRRELSTKQQTFTSKKLHRYSMSFYANKNTINISSLPTPDNYLVSTGDSIGIHVYGDREKNYNLVVKNDGSVELEFIGPVKIAGMQFKKAVEHLKSRLQAHYSNSNFNITISKYSTIQVTLIGDVKYPGIYNLSSFSTPKDLLIAAKGVRSSASVRSIIVKRNSKTIADLDFYDLLFKGSKFTTTLLKNGDVVIIKKAKKLVSIDGYVSHAAIFELDKYENLDQLIRYAGGMKPNASRLNIKIDRYTNNSTIDTFKLSFKEARKFKMKDGDKVYIYPLDFTANSSVNIYGNIIRPGSYRLDSSRTLHSFFKKSLKNGLKSFFLPRTYFEYGVIKRYSSDLTYTSVSFNLADAISGKESVLLRPNDQVFIFSQSDIFSNAYITTIGKTLVRAGKLQYINGMSIQDAINASGIGGVLDDRVRLTTYSTQDFMPKTSFYSLKMEGNVKLSPYDEVEVYDYYAKNILEPVSIKGEVVNPTTVYYEDGMSVKSLLDIAGGFNKKAYTKSLSITRYYIDETQTRQQKVLSYDLDKILLSEIDLKPYDEVKISKILGWNREDFEIVSIAGEINRPLTTKYGKGMTLEDIIIMAGGLTKRSYSDSIEIVRYRIDENQTRKRKILKIDMKHTDPKEVILHAYDEVKIFKIPNWSEKYSVKLGGEVVFPGMYSIENGEKLSSVIERAGGYTKEAFIEGAVFTRESIRKNQSAQYNKSLARIKRELAIINAMPANAKKTAAMAASGNSLDEVMVEAKKYEPIGRVSIKLDSNLTAFEESPFNLTLNDKDSIIIPSQIDTITVFGEVFNPTSFIYDEEKSLEDYIAMASGYSRTADESSVYVIHADGTSEPIYGGWFSAAVEIKKGDTIVVPIYIKENNALDVWDSVAKILASFALTAAAINSLGII